MAGPTPTYISLAYADALERGNVSEDGSYYVELSGCLNLPQNAELSCSKIWLHQPGSDAEQAGSIRVASPVSTTIRCWPFLTTAATGDGQHDLKLGMLSTANAITFWGQKQGIWQLNPTAGGFLHYDVLLTIPAGVYSPSSLSALLTEQSRTLRYDLPPLPHGIATVPRSQTCVLVDSQDFTTSPGFNQYEMMDLNMPQNPGSSNCLPFASSTPGTAIPVGSTSGIAFLWDSTKGRFAVGSMHTPLYSAQQNGSLCAARAAFYLNGQTRSSGFVGASGGLAVPTPGAAAGIFEPVPASGSFWCATENFEDSIWPILGFQSVSELERGDYGNGWTTTDNLVDSSMLAGGSALSLTFATTQVYELSDTANTSALYASGPPAVNAPAFWSVLCTGVIPTSFRDAGGWNPSWLTTVDASFASYDCLVASDGPPHVCSQPVSIAGVRVQFIDSSTKKPIQPGPRTCVLLQIVQPE